MPLLDLAQLYQPLHIVEDPAQIPCRGHAARSGFKIVIISITNINMIPVIMLIAKILILPHQDFNDFSMRGSFRFVNTLCTDSTLTRCLLMLIFPSEMMMMMMRTGGTSLANFMRAAPFDPQLADIVNMPSQCHQYHHIWKVCL